MSNTYRLLVFVDAQPERAVLVDLPEDLVPLDMWSRTEVPLGSPHKFEIEIRRIT